MSRSRIATLPDVPTFAEAGLPEFHYDAWFGLLAHANTPRPIIDQISQETGKILQLPELRARLSQQGVEIVFNASDQFDEIIKRDTSRFEKILAGEDITPR